MQNTENKCNNLQEFIKQSKARLKKILKRLEWSEDAVKKSFNTNSLASIQAKKKIKQVPLAKTSEYPDSCYDQNNVTLETQQLQELLQNNKVEAPRNFQELQLNFKREEKLKIYEHVIENTRKLENNLETPVAEGELSLAEIVAQKKREEKRKKRRFRKSKPTHIEEVRCLVELQMQALRQFLNTNENEMHRQENKKEYHREHGQDLTDTYGKCSTKYRKELCKRSYSQSRSKELHRDCRRNHSRSPIKQRHHEHRRSGRNGERKPQDRSPSEEHTSKNRRRSRSKSSDRHSKYNHYKSSNNPRSKRSRSKSQRKYRDRSKSPYRRDTKQYESPRRKRRSVSKEPGYTKAYKKEGISESKSTRNSSSNCDRNIEKQIFENYQNSRDRSAYFARRSKSKSPHKREIKQYNQHNETPRRKRRSVSKESSCQSRENLYSRTSAKHKHSKTKKKKHKRDHS